MIPERTIFWYKMFSIVPVLPALDLILQPFSLSVMVESEKVMPETELSLFPPTEPMLKPLKRSQSAFYLPDFRRSGGLTVLQSRSFLSR